MGSLPEPFENVSVVCNANIFFDGRVVSHTVLFKDGSKKTLGLIYPGSYEFQTKGAEVMAIIAGDCRVKVRPQAEFTACPAGSSFRAPANSAFTIAVDKGIAQYICSFE